MYTIQEIHLKMAELNNPDNVYTTKRLKQKLKERYKDHLCFIMLPGRTDVVRFKDMASYILYQLKKKPQTKEEILQAAAHLIKADIRELQQSKNMYPSVNDINDDGVTSRCFPESLNTFFQCLIPSEIKRKGICQCITQAFQETQIYYMLYSIWIRCWDRIKICIKVVSKSSLSIRLQYIIQWGGPLQGISDQACRRHHARTTGRPRAFAKGCW